MFELIQKPYSVEPSRVLRKAIVRPERGGI
jgi:hypothetical protein